MKVLVVDDCREDRILYRRRLQQRVPNATFSEAESGAEGLAMFRGESPDVVLLDYNLPDFDGLCFLEQLRQVVGGSDELPVVMMTGQGSETVAVEAMKRGAQDYLAKSVITAEALERVARNAIERCALHERLEQQRVALEQSNRDLECRNEEIRRFYQLVSHELKNPLTSIREFVAILGDGLVGPVNEEQAELLALSKQSCDDMTTYIDDLLDTARIETGKFEIRPELTCFAPLIEGVVARHLSTARERDVLLELTHEVAADLQASVDPSRLRQVVSNLIGNALKFTPAGGTVRVHLAIEDGQFRTEVIDTGIGISAEHCAHIFDRLYQTERNESHGVRGLGLGLNIAQQIVELHGGAIEVESEVGVGSTFRFRIPTTRTHSHPFLGKNAAFQPLGQWIDPSEPTACA